MTANDNLEAAIAAGEFATLRSFLRGYLHEDVKDEYGTALEAAGQFCEDAEPDERKAVAGEWLRFADASADLPLGEVNRLLTRKLGGAYLFSSPQEFQEITALFRARAAK
jgi:hypothetical protein